MSVYKPGEGVIHWDVLRRVMNEPLRHSFGIFFYPFDQAAQSSIGPLANPAEAVLLAVGLIIVLIEGFSLNILLLLHFGLVMVLCGAFTGESHSTRLLQTVPLACLFMARALTAIIDLFSSGRVRTALFWLIVAAAIVVSPLYNLRAYARFETGADGRGRDRWERAVIGDHMQALGPRYHYYIVVTGYEPWVLRGIWHTEINPYLWGLQLTEVYELQLALPLPEGQPGVFILQPNRRDEQLAIIRHYHPVRIEEVRSPLGRHFADFAIVEQP